MSQEGEATEREAGGAKSEPPPAPIVPRRPLRIAEEPEVSSLKPPSVPPAAASDEPSFSPSVAPSVPPATAPSVPPIAAPSVPPRASVPPVASTPPEARARVRTPLPQSLTPTEELDEGFLEDADPTPVLARAAEIVSRPPPAFEGSPASALSTEETLALLEEDEPEVEVELATPAPPPTPERKPPPPNRSQKPALPSASTPRKKPWWEEVFGDDFSRGHRGLGPEAAQREVAFIASQLGLERGAVVLDLCCGQGELTIEMNRRGFSVVGYDLSVYQLAVAGDNAQNAKQKINFLQGDMREMAFDAMFDAIVCWDTSFGYFEEEKNLDVARRMFQALKPGGSLLLDVLNRDHVALNSPHNHWFEGDGCICMDDMQLDWITSRLKVKRSIILDDGRSKELTFSIRLYTLSELGKLLHDVGFRVASVSGHPATPGAFLGPQSPRIIIRADRPE